MIPPNVRQHLLQEPRIAPLLDELTVPERPDFGGDVYFGLQRSIAYQQLSGKAAGTIFGRFLQLFPDEYPHPEQLLAMDDDLVRSAGMSRSKTAYVKNVAQYWIDHRLLNVNWDDYADEQILDMLTSIKGVGQWTVEMVLMFILKRPDLLPLDDLIVKRNIIKLFDVDAERLRGKKLNAELLRVTEPWRPYRSYASRVMWALYNTEI
ncbi:DNA-3-methyladenine glycosylase [Lewinella sp. W8]|uniref:DNA-3-methyladenine glycosylase family protein n=1 Tax=Lewinella sp. W8 TaxID=2528208 RepID=UPI0010674041|nr:DNA-3-methyladenine glycosylase [Lewinella sp. W8]MTB53590.1 DNA-3-methyladenine glycosylase 2 family protein [Lewinella sp. W8]